MKITFENYLKDIEKKFGKRFLFYIKKLKMLKDLRFFHSKGFIIVNKSRYDPNVSGYCSHIHKEIFISKKYKLGHQLLTLRHETTHAKQKDDPYITLENYLNDEFEAFLEEAKLYPLLNKHIKGIFSDCLIHKAYRRYGAIGVKSLIFNTGHYARYLKKHYNKYFKTDEPTKSF